MLIADIPLTGLAACKNWTIARTVESMEYFTLFEHIEQIFFHQMRPFFIGKSDIR